MAPAAATGHSGLFLSPLQASLRTLLQPFFLFARYDKSHLRADVLAGITTGVILVPQSVAYALIADLPPQTGLYTALIAAIAGSLWGSSRHLHTGPTNAASLLVLAAVSPLASSANLPEYLAAVGLLTVMTGLMRLALGLLRLGFIVNFVSDAVVVGFTAGAGMLIIVNQMGGLLGLDIAASVQFQATGLALWAQASSLHALSLGLGLATLALIFVLPRIRKQLPHQFLAVFLVSLLVFALRLDRQGVAIIGPLPQALPPWQPVPLADGSLWQALAPGAGAIAVIGLIEALTIARTLATESGQYLDNDQEMVGQGIANILCGFLSGYCSSGSFTRSTVNYRAGGRTQLTSVISGLFVLGSVLGLGVFIQYLSRPVLAGFVIATALTMVKYRRIRQIAETSKSETFIMVVTFAAAFFVPLVYVVATGIVVSLLIYVYKTSRPRVLPLAPTRNFRHLRTLDKTTDNACPQLSILSIEGDLYFGAANHVEHLLRDYIPPPGTRRFVLLQLQHMVRVDISGVRMLESFVRIVRQRGGDVYFFKITDIAQRLFASSGFRAYAGADHFLEDDSAIEFLFQRVLNPKECIYDCPYRVFKECQNLPKIAIPFQDLLLKRPAAPRAALIDVEEVFQRLMANDSTLAVIDVREQLEWDQGHIPKARHIPYSAFSPHSAALDPNRELVLVSNTMRRARNVGWILQESGFSDAKVMNGGMQAWMRASHIVALTEYGRS